MNFACATVIFLRLVYKAVFITVYTQHKLRNLLHIFFIRADANQLLNPSLFAGEGENKACFSASDNTSDKSRRRVTKEKKLHLMVIKKAVHPALDLPA